MGGNGNELIFFFLVRFLYFCSLQEVMTPIKVIALIIAAVLFVRGIICLILPKWSKAFSIGLLKFSKKTYNWFGIVLIIISFVMFMFILFMVELIDLIIILFAALFFMSGYSLLVAQKETKQLWKALLSMPEKWTVVFGILNILVAIIIALLFFY